MCNKRPKDRKLDEGRIFNTDPHSSKWYWAIWQKRTGCSSKNCHISDLYFTNCTQEKQTGRTGMWKTRWKVWNSTRKTGFKTGLLNFIHRVFNMWKKWPDLYGLYTTFLWKTFLIGKTEDACAATEWRCTCAAKHFCKKERGLQKRKMRQTVNRVWKLLPDRDKKWWFTGKQRRHMLYFKMSYHMETLWCAVQDAAHLLEGARSTFR